MTGPEKKRVYRLLAAGWLIFLVLLSFLPQHLKFLIHTKGQMHNAAHFVVFSILAFLMASAAKTRDQQITNLFFAIVVGFGIEIIQDLKVMLPSNGDWVAVEWTDILVDAMAVVFVGILLLGILPAFRRRAGSLNDDRVLGR